MHLIQHVPCRFFIIVCEINSNFWVTIVSSLILFSVAVIYVNMILSYIHWFIYYTFIKRFCVGQRYSQSAVSPCSILTLQHNNCFPWPFLALTRICLGGNESDRMLMSINGSGSEGKPWAKPTYRAPSVCQRSMQILGLGWGVEQLFLPLRYMCLRSSQRSCEKRNTRDAG